METILKNKGRFDINVNKTKVLLIGVSNYTDDRTIRNIPNVKENIRQLKSVFMDKEIVGIPKENIQTSVNETRKLVERKLKKLAMQADNSDFTIIVYYSGHGILSSENFKLYLTTRESTKEYLDTDSVDISKFRQIIASSRAKRKIIILDACHSGQIHNAMSNFESKISSELKKFEGMYIMTSASEDDPSLYPHNETHHPTYFTAKLIDVLRNGIESEKPYLTIRDIYSEILNCFRNQKGLPLPQQSVFQNADEIMISLNRAYTGKIEPLSLQTKSQINRNNKYVRESFAVTRKKSPFKTYIIAGTIIGSIVVVGGTTWGLSSLNANREPIGIEKPIAVAQIENKRQFVEPPPPINQEARELIREGGRLFDKGEMYYHQALLHFREANKMLGGDANVENRIAEITRLINKSYNNYMKRAKVYMLADSGSTEALVELNKALKLKPYDTVVQNLIDSINSNKAVD